MDTQAKIEIFRLVKGRLPNEATDKVDREMCMKFLDMIYEGKIDEKYHYLKPFVFDLIGRKFSDLRRI